MNPLTVQAVRYIETDGGIAMHHRNKGTHLGAAFPTVNFTQAAHRAEPMMDLLNEGFGIKGSRWWQKNPGRGVDCRLWQTNQRTTAQVVALCLPHLIVKKEQFQLAHEFLQLFNALPDRGPSGRKSWTPELRAHSLEVAKEMSRLNHLGVKE